MTTSKETHPDLYCHYVHCRRKLSPKQRRRNERMAEFFAPEQMGLYCSRRHKELQKQHRRSLANAQLRQAARVGLDSLPL